MYDATWLSVAILAGEVEMGKRMYLHMTKYGWPNVACDGMGELSSGTYWFGSIPDGQQRWQEKNKRVTTGFHSMLRSCSCRWKNAFWLIFS